MEYHELDLDLYERTGSFDTPLEERKQVNVCGKVFDIKYDRCLATGAFGASIAFGVANLLYTNSQNRQCTPEEFDNKDYQYAVRATGKCHTDAQRNTIEGAIDHYIDEKVPSTTCGVRCMQLTHGGQWRGYVVFGAPTYDWEKYLAKCANVAQIGQCVSGGKKYVGDLG